MRREGTECLRKTTDSGMVVRSRSGEVWQPGAVGLVWPCEGRGRSKVVELTVLWSWVMRWCRLWPWRLGPEGQVVRSQDVQDLRVSCRVLGAENTEEESGHRVVVVVGGLEDRLAGASTPPTPTPLCGGGQGRVQEVWRVLRHLASWRRGPEGRGCHVMAAKGAGAAPSTGGGRSGSEDEWPQVDLGGEAGRT